MHRLGDDDLLAVLHHALREQHRLAERRRAVVERGVGDVESRQQALVGLIFEDRLQRPLRHLGLVRRVRGEELGAHQELIDARGLVVQVGAGAEE